MDKQPNRQCSLPAYLCHDPGALFKWTFPAAEITLFYDFGICQLKNFVKNTEETEIHFIISLILLLPCPEYSIKPQQKATKSLMHLLELILTLQTLTKAHVKGILL